MAKFLDENGVKKLWSRIQEYVYECCCSKGGGGDSGYECTTSLEKAFSESGTTTKEEGSNFSQYILDYKTTINVDEIKVVFNGTEYICPKMTRGNSVAYGSPTPDFEDYPFTLDSNPNLKNVLYTQDPMDFSITVYVPSTTATVTPCFEAAVKAVTGDSKGVKVIHIKDDGKGGYTCDTSCDDIERILKDGGYVAAYHNGSFYNLDNIVGGSDSTYIGFSRVDIKTRSSENQQVIKKEFVFSLNDCTIQYSDKRYPKYS